MDLPRNTHANWSLDGTGGGKEERWKNFGGGEGRREESREGVYNYIDGNGVEK